MHKIKILTLIILFFNTTACDVIISGISESTKGSIKTDIVRGPTGGSSGGGIIIVDNDYSNNAKYEIYFTEGFLNKKIDSGLLPSDGKIELSTSDLTSDMLDKIQNGKAKIVIEVLDGEKKSVASGKLIPEGDSDTINIG